MIKTNMKKRLIVIACIGIVITALTAFVASAAPTSTIVQNLVISGLASSPTAGLTVDSGGPVATSSTPTAVSSVQSSTDITMSAATGTNIQASFASHNISQFTNDSGYKTSVPATTTINGAQCPVFTFSIVVTSSASSITTSTCSTFFNLLQNSSGTDINVAANGQINFVNPGYITTSTFNATGTAFNFPYWNSAGNALSPTSSIFISSSTGNVGIGTTTPAKTLSVAGDSVFGVNSWLTFLDTDGGNGRMITTNINAFDSGGGVLFRNNAGTTQ